MATVTLRRIFLIVSLLAANAACSVLQPEPSRNGTTMPKTVNEVGTAYVKLVLALGQHDADYVDAYYGPASWREEVERRRETLPQIEAEAGALLNAVDGATTTQTLSDPELPGLRRQYLKTQLSALIARAQMLQGRKLSFDEEARALYDTDAPHYAEKDFAPARERIDKLLPKGKGTLTERYNRYIERYAVPAGKLEAVMQAAIGEARARAYSHMPLPLGERFELSLVSGKPWSAYNWYQGRFVSRIEVNTDLPIPVSRVIDLAAHEGYPGHHVYNGLLEVGLVNDLGWPEYQVYALFSPQSLIAEGTADYGVGLAFPGGDKLELTRTLFKQSGFDPKQAGTYLKIATAARELAPAGIEAARRYLDGTMGAEETVCWLQKYTLASPERARQRLAFFDKYRAYVINYTWGEELVHRYVKKNGGRKAGADSQWQAFFALISTPRTPAGLRVSQPPARSADVNDFADFDRFITARPTIADFHARYPKVQVVMPGTITTREFRADRSRYFPELDAADGRIDGGHFE